MMDVKERLKLFVKHTRQGQGAFEEAVGIGNGTINNAKNGFSSSTLTKIIDKYPELNMYWLLNEVGPMILPDEYINVITGKIKSSREDYEKLYFELIDKLKELNLNVGLKKPAKSPALNTVKQFLDEHSGPGIERSYKKGSKENKGTSKKEDKTSKGKP